MSPLEKKPKKEPRPIPVTVRLSKRAVETLKHLAEAYNRSQADVIDSLLVQEAKYLDTKTKK